MPLRAKRGNLARSALEGYFSADYATARQRFRDAAHAAGAALDELFIEAKGPNAEPLAIDIAWLGAEAPRRVFLHTTGLHGLEAFTGSAVQLALLDKPPARGPHDALMLVHVLNPYGMAWLRRANEHNVDLNRNFLLDGEPFTGAPTLYRALDPLLNPRSPPSTDAFALRAAAAALRFGFHRVKQAIAEGQYEFPQGLFFGGRELQPGPERYTAWLRHHLGGAQYVFALDLHTGLGRHATDTVLLEEKSSSARDALAQALSRRFVEVSGPSVAYTVRGALGAAMFRVLEHARVDCVLQEIGTHGPLTVLHALREENRWHFFGDGSIVHPAKQRMREALCPAAPAWRAQAVALGVDLAQRAARWTFDHGL